MMQERNSSNNMNISIRKMTLEDIENKVKWINDDRNNQFLHYDLPLVKEKTTQWFEKVKDNPNRYDGIIECDQQPVGVIGLLSIDGYQAEYYITLGEQDYKGKGIAKEASLLLLNKAFFEYQLSQVILYTECENISAQKLFDRIGFKKSGVETGKTLNRGKLVDRYFYTLSKDDFIARNLKTFDTPIYLLNEKVNNIYIKRDDLIPFSFGGNKARKAVLFFEEIERGHHDCVVTYGTSSSNHCRIIANMAKKVGIPCYIIGPNEESKETYNSQMMKLFDANITTVPVNEVHDTIENKLTELRNEGKNPYFIEGGGHGNIGTHAILGCYREIHDYEKENDIHFDYIFFASGTGTTQAGVVCGKLLYNDPTKVIGISIARKNPRGRDVVLDSIHTYLKENQIEISKDKIETETIFVDEYTGNKYGAKNEEIKQVIQKALMQYGLPLDFTYTGKAFYGMQEYIKKNKLRDNNILFIHTGGTPLFFDGLKEVE